MTPRSSDVWEGLPCDVGSRTRRLLHDCYVKSWGGGAATGDQGFHEVLHIWGGMREARGSSGLHTRGASTGNNRGLPRVVHVVAQDAG